MSLAARSMTELLAAFRASDVSPVDLAHAVLDQTAATEPALNAFVVREAPEAVLAQAKAAQDRWHRGAPAGALDGIPMTIKDAIITAKWPTRSGSLTTSSEPGPDDAPAVARVFEAGAIIVGKTTTPEFGWKAVTDSPLTGISRNPWNTALTPGGSSGGAAAAVAAGHAIASIGTDAGGSVRIPAAFCGLVAMKATRGRIPAYPPSAVWTAGHIGPIARTVADTALLLDVMTRADARDWNALPPPQESYVAGLPTDGDAKGLRIAYSPTLGHAKVHPEVADLVDRAARRFEELGSHVEVVDTPLPDARDAFNVYFQTGIAHSLRRLTPEAVARLDPGLAAVLIESKAVSRETFLEAYDFQIRISREARRFHQDYDVLITPTVAVPPFAAGRLSPPGYDQANWLEWSPFTYPFNLSGQPAMSLNCGYTRAGLPVGLQLVGPMYGEAVLLRASRSFEASIAHEARRLPVFVEA
ncbi:amidase [Roseiarcaceae bacterium H3SJ34-1]|uniref:amidase n=1 Tax=Terripilifer ovatus TaxID=3032367 RepID=UPI003AB9A215|nr:amidase [Roseiarcaceae bacterium H3SJ34-1]